MCVSSSCLLFPDVKGSSGYPSDGGGDLMGMVDVFDNECGGAEWFDYFSNHVMNGTSSRPYSHANLRDVCASLPPVVLAHTHASTINIHKKDNSIQWAR